jgi:hypothetical protein
MENNTTDPIRRNVNIYYINDPSLIECLIEKNKSLNEKDLSLNRIKHVIDSAHDIRQETKDLINNLITNPSTPIPLLECHKEGKRETSDSSLQTPKIANKNSISEEDSQESTCLGESFRCPNGCIRVFSERRYLREHCLNGCKVKKLSESKFERLFPDKRKKNKDKKKEKKQPKNIVRSESESSEDDHLKKKRKMSESTSSTPSKKVKHDRPCTFEDCKRGYSGPNARKMLRRHLVGDHRISMEDINEYL